MVLGYYDVSRVMYGLDMLKCDYHHLEGNPIRGLEQNPETKSRWAQMARDGKKVMQFLREGRYVANVVDGKASLYGKR